MTCSTRCAIPSRRCSSTRSGRHQNLRLHLNISQRDGSLSIEAIERVAGNLAAVTVYMYGPVPMIEAFEGASLERGVHRRDIHCEEFAFR